MLFHFTVLFYFIETRTHILQSSLELLMLLPLPPKNWDSCLAGLDADETLGNFCFNLSATSVLMLGRCSHHSVLTDSIVHMGNNSNGHVNIWGDFIVPKFKKQKRKATSLAAFTTMEPHIYPLAIKIAHGDCAVKGPLSCHS